MIHALLPLSDTLLASGGADCAVRIFDMGAQTLAHTLSPSNAVHNLHSLAATHSNSILLEVSHKELQFEVRDTRIDKTSRVSRFGWVAGKTSGKYVRGAVRGEVFACGDRDGVVRVWDLRNTCRPIETVRYTQSIAWVHALTQVFSRAEECVPWRQSCAGRFRWWEDVRRVGGERARIH